MLTLFQMLNLWYSSQHFGDIIKGCLVLLLEVHFSAEASSNRHAWKFLVILKTLISLCLIRAEAKLSSRNTPDVFQK